MHRRAILLVFSSLVIPALCGCKTDALFRGEPAPPGSLIDRQAAKPIDEPDAHEVDIVESMIANRQQYHHALAALRDFYAGHNNEAKRRQVDFELAGLEKTQTFQYLLDAEIPPASLRPSEQIEAADRLYIHASNLLRRGGHGLLVLYREELMIKALKAFKSLIETYPTSDKIDDAAFYCGEIHKEYFRGQELIAVRWYERAWQWDPETPHPARFQAAVVYDYRLHDRARALELYHAVIERETMKITNVRFATRRINELTQARGRAVRVQEPTVPLTPATSVGVPNNDNE